MRRKKELESEKDTLQWNTCLEDILKIGHGLLIKIQRGYILW
jgi:hypothetical protein